MSYCLPSALKLSSRPPRAGSR